MKIQKMPHNTAVKFFILAVFMAAAFPRAESSQTAKDVKNKIDLSAADKYTVELSSRTLIPQSELQELFLNGYGRREMAAVVLISVKGGVSIKEVASHRDKLTALREICGFYGLTYEEIINEAHTIKQEIERLIYLTGYEEDVKGE